MVRILTFFLTLSASGLFAAKDWLQFRGPNSQGIAEESNLPIEFGPNQNVVWKTPLPPGHSSPVLVGDRIFLTAFDDGKLFTFALDRGTGRISGVARRRARASRSCIR